MCSRVCSSTTHGSPLGRWSGCTSQSSLNHNALSVPSSQLRQPTPPSPCRGGSSEGGSSSRGVTGPVNGQLSHSSTGGAASAPSARSHNASGVSGTFRCLLVRALPLLVPRQVLAGVDVAE